MAKRESGLDKIQKTAAKLARMVGPESPLIRRFMLAIGNKGANITVYWMNKGIDIHGRPFKAYSEHYLLVRQGKRPYAYAGGRPLYTTVGGNPEHVNLSLRGLMQASIQPFMKTNTTVEWGAGAGGIYKTHNELARRHDLGLGVPKREFLGIAPDHVRAFNDIAEKMIPDLLKEAAGNVNG